MAITCPNGHVNDEGNRFCDQCGAPLTGAPSVSSNAPSESQISVTTDGSIVCATCGQENLPGTAFCENCGAQLPLPAPAAIVEAAPETTSAVSAEGVKCSNCGAVNETGNTFCEQCGASLAVASDAPTALTSDEPPPATDDQTSASGPSAQAPEWRYFTTADDRRATSTIAGFCGPGYGICGRQHIVCATCE